MGFGRAGRDWPTLGGHAQATAVQAAAAVFSFADARVLVLRTNTSCFQTSFVVHEKHRSSAVAAPARPLASSETHACVAAVCADHVGSSLSLGLNHARGLAVN